MKKSIIAGGLLVSTALVAPSAALAQAAGQPSPAQNEAPPADSAATAQDPAATAQPPEEQEPEIEVSVPGMEPTQETDIVITGTRRGNIMRRTPQVISLLSSEDIARTGEGDIAGALTRVTGLSVVGSGFVYVRGLGDRYSLALLNGSPLPSPEPLRRVVPLDIFPTSVIASSLVQKSYSVNYPGEFGGGVINLTSRAIPRDPFLQIGVSGSIDTETTGQLGYTYFGSDLDRFGFDDGTRTFPSAIRSAISSGNYGATTSAQRIEFAAGLVNAETTLLRRNNDVPANFSAEVSSGTSFDLGGTRIGLIAAASYSSTWRTRDILQQTSADAELDPVQTSFRSVITDNRVLVNGLFGLGIEFDEHAIRWTNLFIRDTLKQGRLAAGFNVNVAPQDPNLPPSIIEQNTYWFERQLIDTQLVGEFQFGDFSLDLRGTYANTRRNSPYERDFSYVYLGDGDPTTKSTGDVDDYVNNLSSAGQNAYIAFSELTEDLWSGGLDLSYRIPNDIIDTTLSAGYAYTLTERNAFRFQFQYTRPFGGALPIGPSQMRPDFLLSQQSIRAWGIELTDVSGAEGAPAYDAELEIHGGYAQAEFSDDEHGLRATVGVRYEQADQSVLPISTNPVFATQTNLSNDYFLPAGTVTWNFRPDMQLRFHVSKTIARPQFRELAQQIYQDYESDREFTGNPLLVDSELFNMEGRYEWYFRRDERITLAGFYKRIDNPIEAVASLAGGDQLRTTFANAPRAELYGVEAELQTYIPLRDLGDMFSTRRILLIGNYTWSQSELQVSNRCTALPGVSVAPCQNGLPANLLFEDGAPMTGQSEHLVNIQIGLEDTDRLSQYTFLFNYASDRVTNRGPITSGVRQPDIIERPGLRVDFVAREGVNFLGREVELKFEARNIFGRDYEEFQEFGDNRIDINSYRVGRTFSLGMTMNF
ncbi:TonB-dependent receptor [Sphingosinicella sp. LHD-64]|uniref:TonB-dependent receptor domain-containing protein n=1 Tax=Sphingosinicella sp. LHD-64 TaxID=3072139 RepID=UPI00280E6EC6|nr:TonB-dependent receptor [Sphingosinicella sp. LHD-64]MDQ8755206.1 TonB-dependent receptor [Sphingosinicella sp. LHD-64]